MKTKLIIPSIVFILLIPFASAQTFNGYFEPFEVCPPVQPAFYTSFTQNSFTCADGTLRTLPTGTQNANLILTTVVTNQFFSFDIDLHISRPCVDSAGSAGFQCVPPSGCHQPGGNIGFRQTAGGVASQIVAENYQCIGGDGTNFGTSALCGTTSVDDLTLSKTTHFTIQYAEVGTVGTWTLFSSNGINCTFAEASNPNLDTVAAFEFGASSQTNRAGGDFIYWDNLVWNNGNGANFTIEQDPTTAVGSEFDSGLRDLASGVGFKSPESQLLFAIILIGLSEIGMAFLVGFMNPGKWQNWFIHTVAATVGIVMVLLTYLELWILLVGIVLASTIVNGGRESINTFRSLASFRKTAASPTVAAASMPQDGPRDAALRPGLEGQEDSAASEPEDSAESEPEKESESEPVAESEAEAVESDSGSEQE